MYKIQDILPLIHTYINKYISEYLILMAIIRKFYQMYKLMANMIFDIFAWNNGNSFPINLKSNFVFNKSASVRIINL